MDKELKKMLQEVLTELRSIRTLLESNKSKMISYQPPKVWELAKMTPEELKESRRHLHEAFGITSDEEYFH